MALTNQPGYRPTLVHLSVRCVVPIAGGEAGAGDFAFCSMRSNTLQARSCAPACAYSSIMLAVCCAFSAGAYAQSSAATGVVMDETVVAATRSSQPLSDTLADVSIVDRETLDLSGAAALEDVLSRLPGVEMVRNGGPGSTTSVYLRGATMNLRRCISTGFGWICKAALVVLRGRPCPWRLLSAWRCCVVQPVRCMARMR